MIDVAGRGAHVYLSFLYISFKLLVQVTMAFLITIGVVEEIALMCGRADMVFDFHRVVRQQCEKGVLSGRLQF